MKSLLHHLSCRKTVRPRRYPSKGFDLLPADKLLEEETTPNYNASNYYPVKIGQVLHDKYQVVSKLGFGANATVWLCRDLTKNSLYAIKVYTSNHDTSCQVAVSESIKTIVGSHPGRGSLQTVKDSFQISGAIGFSHDCLVFDPMGVSYTQLQDAAPNRGLSNDLIYKYATSILYALGFLHHIGIIHGAVSSDNIRLSVDHKVEITNIEAAEIAHPSPRKVLPDRTIYSSYIMPITPGSPVLCNFFASLLGKPRQTHPGITLTSGTHCAPEMVLKMEFDCKTDVWSFGVLMWQLVTGKPLFRSHIPGQQSNDAPYLAEIVSLIGPPSAQFLQRNRSCYNIGIPMETGPSPPHQSHSNASKISIPG
ncbi:hypothetical protein VHEMI03352 [[Torrubiella] hemipterigena]|uniref:non-specific serine/threonine protein kinase n=1 Tax=[Torrubiella] hemipterigena TaxID=1531966 RepID=A0A0A1SSB7_9HYPO|nr:hypothetical protein VHEMI03352 [[Torrubiella] hemipterigena]